MSTKKVTKRKRKLFKHFTGTVVLEPMYQGSKSERLAVKLDTGEDKLLMRRFGARSYRDDVLEELVGKTITCKGLERAGRLYLKTFVLDRQDVADE